MLASVATIAGSLAVLTGLLAVLSLQSIRRFFVTRARVQLTWTVGLLFATAAMVIETLVYFGWAFPALLAAYVFFSAAIVGVLSLGATRVFRHPRAERAYLGFTVGMCSLLAAASFLAPSSNAMVRDGIIMGNPSTLLVVISSLITFPATGVLLAASAVALRRSRDWRTLFLVVGALILGVGGTLYIAAFPVALYYAEFLGIVLLFFGLVNLPHPSVESAPTAAARTVE